MRIVARYSFNKGQEVIQQSYIEELREIEAAIASVDAAAHRTKESREVTMQGRMLYSPVALNKTLLDNTLYVQGWTKPRINYSTTIPETGEKYTGFIEGDGVKNGLGLEVQFGKYAFLGWDVLGKMPIFAKHGYFSAAVEVVPMRVFVRGQMSSGIGCFEQIKAILEYRGVSDLDIPVLLLGIASEEIAGEPTAVLADQDVPPDVE